MIYEKRLFRNLSALSSHNIAAVNAFVMNTFIAQLKVFGLSSGPRQQDKIKAYINSRKSE